MSTALQPPQPIHIDPIALYTTYTAAIALETTVSVILTAIRRGELHAVRRGRLTYISGRALLTWLTPSEVTAEAKAVRS
jgi:hypothetical protein